MGPRVDIGASNITKTKGSPAVAIGHKWQKEKRSPIWGIMFNNAEIEFCGGMALLMSSVASPALTTGIWPMNGLL